MVSEVVRNRTHRSDQGYLGPIKIHFEMNMKMKMKMKMMNVGGYDWYLVMKVIGS